MQKTLSILGSALLFFGCSVDDQSDHSNPKMLPTSNAETFAKFLPNDYEIVTIKPHPSAAERVGVLFVTSQSLKDLRSFYSQRFPDHRIDLDIDLEPHLVMSLFEGSDLPAVVVAGLDEPTNRGFADIYFTDDDWSSAVSSGREIIGMLAVDDHLLPDGINKSASSSPNSLRVD